MARVDLRTGDPGPVRALLRDPVVAGVRLVFLPADAGRLDDPQAEWFWSFAEEEDVPVMLLASGQLDALGDLARSRPGLRLAVDHLGLTGQHTDAAIAPEITDLVALARHDNVSVKATATPCYSTEAYPYPALHPFLRAAVQRLRPRAPLLGLGPLPAARGPIPTWSASSGRSWTSSPR